MFPQHAENQNITVPELEEKDKHGRILGAHVTRKIPLQNQSSKVFHRVVDD